MGKSDLFDRPIVVDGVCYFASDFHLGVPSKAESALRESRILAWLDAIAQDATHLFLLGDIFDFWFEYRDVVPKGCYRLFAKFAELREKGVTVYYFTGNHDMWVKDYFSEEFGFQIFRKQQAFIINGKRCFVGHGDGLGPKDWGYKVIKRIFAFRPNILIYNMLHPRVAFALARYCSRKSRAMTPNSERAFLGEQEFLIQHCRSVLARVEVDYFIYGHRHLPIDFALTEAARYLNTGDWLTHDTYVRFDAAGACLRGAKRERGDYFPADFTD